MSSQPGSFLDWKQTLSVLGAWPVLPQRPSEWFPLKGCREMVRGAETEGEALSRWPSPTVGDIEGRAPHHPQYAEISGQLEPLRP